MQKLYREHSREYSLFRVWGAYKVVTKKMPNILKSDVSSVIAVYRGKDLVDVYYGAEFMKDLFKLTAVYAKDKEKVKQDIENYYQMFQFLKPYFTQEIKPGGIDEFKKAFEVYVDFWSFIAIIFLIPNLPKVDEELKAMALKAREDTQEYNEAFEPVIKEFLETNYSSIKGYYRFVMPDEVWENKIFNRDYLESIKPRKKGYVYYEDQLTLGDVEANAKKFGLELLVSTKEYKDVKEFNGQIAQKGKVKGIVKVMTSIKQLDKVKEGEILVASMTMPNYLPAMKKAAAFVTDEGGITCHAAIVSREMKKPCVIGTKIATQVLKDGMEVEVDADKGIIRIL